MLAGLVVLIVFQFIGEGIAWGTGLPVPGPVIGFVALFVAALAWPRLIDITAPMANTLLGFLTLLFVPAGVGIMQYTDVLRTGALPLAAVVTLSTAATMAVTAVVFHLVSRSVAANETAGDSAAECRKDGDHHE